MLDRSVPAHTMKNTLILDSKVPISALTSIFVPRPVLPTLKFPRFLDTTAEVVLAQDSVLSISRCAIF